MLYRMLRQTAGNDVVWDPCQNCCTHPLSKEASRASVDKTAQVFTQPSYHVQLPPPFHLFEILV